MKKLILSAIAVLTLLTGCAAGSHSQGYYRQDAYQTQSVLKGTLESVRVVRIAGTTSGVGAVAGGVLGGVVGNSMGKGNGRKIMTILGVLAGAGVGSAAEQSANEASALEMLITLETGRQILVTQALSYDQFYLGQRVLVITDGRTSRVSPT